jgi:hypothetical protein
MALHFTKVHPEFAALAWIAGNFGISDREYTNRIIKVEEVDGIVHLIGTDLYRMPIVRYRENCPLEIGYYKIVKNSKTDLLLEKSEIENYLNWQLVFPKDNLNKIERPNKEFSFTKTKYDSAMQTDLFFLFLNGCCVNYEWVEDIGAFFDTAWDVYHTDDFAVLHGISMKKSTLAVEGGEYVYAHDYYRFSLLAMKLRIPNYPAKSDSINEQKKMTKRKGKSN